MGGFAYSGGTEGWACNPGKGLKDRLYGSSTLSAELLEGV
jgi:hypothetical protein